MFNKKLLLQHMVNEPKPVEEQLRGSLRTPGTYPPINIDPDNVSRTMNRPRFMRPDTPASYEPGGKSVPPTYEKSKRFKSSGVAAKQDRITDALRKDKDKFRGKSPDEVEAMLGEQNKAAAMALGAALSLGAGGCQGGHCPKPTPGGGQSSTQITQTALDAHKQSQNAEMQRDQGRVDAALDVIRNDRYGGEAYDPAKHGAPKIENYKLPFHMGDHDYQEYKLHVQQHREHSKVKEQ